MKKKTWNKIISLTMIAVFTALLSLAPLAQPVNAASKKTKYMKQARLYIKSGGSGDDAYGDAVKWCDSQEENKDKDKYNDWKAVKGDLNAEAGGKKTKHVILCYQETRNPKEAITDLAVMNESGNYDESAYEVILKEKREMFQDMVDDQKSMIEEYRENYKNGVETAVRAHDFLNGYIEDDSNKLLGDLLLEADDETLVDVLMQSNGQVVISMQDQLALACDTGKTTWLDRLSAYGSYQKLKEKYVKANGGDGKEAKKAMKADFFEKAELLASMWGTMESHFANAENYEKKMNLEALSEEELKALAEDESNEADLLIYEQEKQVMQILASYPYEGDDEESGKDKTLLDFFRQDAEAVSGSNIIYLYPLAASLTEGQIAGLNESVDLFQLVLDAVQATVLNDLDTDKAKEYKKAAEQVEVKEAAEESLKWADAFVEEWQKEPTSVYEGVDREIFTDGVAVTSLAENYGKSTGTNWADGFVESGALVGTAVGLMAGAIVAGAVAGIMAYMANRAGHLEANHIFSWFYKTGAHSEMRGMVRYKNALGYLNRAKAAGFDPGTSVSIMPRVFRGLMIGMTVFAALLAVADIIITVKALMDYYNVDHVPIPHHMVDLSYDEDGDTSYVAYKSVRDDEGKYGDVNAGTGKQWLALYASYDEDAGDPILAPDGKKNNIIVAYGKEGAKVPAEYSPLHFFGAPNTPQNLTFADGSKGWSFKDGKKGTYLYFKRDARAWNSMIPDGENASGEAATVFSSGYTALIAGLSALLGLLLGIAGSGMVRRRKRTAA